MPAKLSTTLKNIQKKVKNNVHKDLINKFYNYLASIDTSESYQNGLLKVLIRYAEYLGPDITFYQIIKKEQILNFLDLKRKMEDKDPDKKWITTWNDYLWRIKYFYRWLYNAKEKDMDSKPNDAWTTPSFIDIKMKRSKRLSPYLETEIWDRDELFYIIKYEQYQRNKPALALLWDLDARPHEIALLQIKHIRLNEKYGEGEIPHEAKTGSGPILFASSFPYVRDWLNEHPFRNQPQARLICSLLNGAPIKADQVNEIMKHLKKRIERLLENGEITDKVEKEKLEYILKTKKGIPIVLDIRPLRPIPTTFQNIH